MSDSGLERFVVAQDAGGTYDRALAELRAARKDTHWMWFVFPQLAGLGRSETAVRYALRDAAEAREYLAHPVLGARLRECAAALLATGTTDAAAVLGPVDAVKLRSSATLFARAAAGTADAAPFEQLLQRFYGGEPDPATTRSLNAASS
ncbi:DUF1810 family protein [Kineococcus sp. R8]|uniref:DUF1810 family protein n=1 Tax=Kineococcus siccus TaxID=2696567 RepID=UPI001412F997|nr:DUF1810 family protein [Kineococcus siccus]